MKPGELFDLTAEEFAEYGMILSTTAGEPVAVNNEYTYWGKIARMDFGDKASSGILLCHDRKPIVKSFERHKRTPEVLVALEGDSVLCLARPSAQPTHIRWFRIKRGDALALHPGTWHWIPFPHGGPECRFLVIFAWGTEDKDLDYVDLDNPVTVVV